MQKKQAEKIPGTGKKMKNWITFPEDYGLEKVIQEFDSPNQVQCEIDLSGSGPLSKSSHTVILLQENHSDNYNYRHCLTNHFRNKLHS